MAVDLNELKIKHDERGSRRARRILWVIPVLAILAGAAFGGYEFIKDRGTGAEGLEVDIVAAAVKKEGGPAPRSFTAGGWVEPAFPWPVILSALTEGRIENLLIQEGDRVEKDATVARLYAEDFEDEVKRAEAALNVAVSKLALLEAGYRVEDIAEARAVLAELKAGQSLAEKVAARSETLSADGVVSLEQAERDLAAVEVAKARVEAQEARLSLLEAGPRKESIDEAKAEVERNRWLLQLARKELSYVDVRAPVSGVVLKLLTEQGRRVTGDKPFVASLYNPGELWVRVDVAQSDIKAVEIGQEVDVQTEAEPGRVFNARVVRIDPSADYAKNTITVRVKLSVTDGRLHPDMTARVSFRSLESGAETGGPPRGRLMIPRVAVVREGAESFVFEVVKGAAVRRKVTLGGTLGDAVEVLEGLSEGAAVVASGLESVKEGVRVKPRAR